MRQGRGAGLAWRPLAPPPIRKGGQGQGGAPCSRGVAPQVRDPQQWEQLLSTVWSDHECALLCERVETVTKRAEQWPEAKKSQLLGDKPVFEDLKQRTETGVKKAGLLKGDWSGEACGSTCPI